LELQRGLVFQPLLHLSVIFVLQPWRRRRAVDGQDGLAYTAVEDVALPGRVAVPTKVDLDDGLVEARGARRRRGRRRGSHLKYRHAAVPLGILPRVPLQGGGGGTAVGTERVGGAFGRQRGELSGGVQVEPLAARRAPEARPVGMEKGVVHEHEDHPGEEAAEDDAEGGHREGVGGARRPVEIPQRTESSVLHQDHQVVDEEPTPAGRHNDK